MTSMGPILALVLLAIPVVCAVGVVLAGVIGALSAAPAPAPLPRAIARVAPAVPAPAGHGLAGLLDDDVTRVFDRRAVAR